MRILALTGTHILTVLLGFVIGIYMLPILTAPESPGVEELQSAINQAQFTGEFRRDLTDSDPFHWGEGDLFVNRDAIAFRGSLSPGPDYRLYLSPEFVETEAAFEALKAEMVQVGLVQTFDNFMVSVPESIDPADYVAAIVWFESFGQFITAAAYQ